MDPLDFIILLVFIFMWIAHYLSRSYAANQGQWGIVNKYIKLQNYTLSWEQLVGTKCHKFYDETNLPNSLVHVSGDD